MIIRQVWVPSYSHSPSGSTRLGTARKGAHTAQKSGARQTLFKRSLSKKYATRSGAQEWRKWRAFQTKARRSVKGADRPSGHKRATSMALGPTVAGARRGGHPPAKPTAGPPHRRVHQCEYCRCGRYRPRTLENAMRQLQRGTLCRKMQMQRAATSNDQRGCCVVCSPMQAWGRQCMTRWVPSGEADSGATTPTHARASS